MDFDNLSKEQLIATLEGEVAKALNEVRHAQDDLEKSTSRLKFTLAVIHNYKNRSKGE
jgi:hypothetical protein